MTDDDTARVRAYEADKERINDLRQGDDTQADVIRRLLGNGDADFSSTVEIVPTLDEDAIDDIREQIETEIADASIDTEAFADAVAEKLAEFEGEA